MDMNSNSIHLQYSALFPQLSPLQNTDKDLERPQNQAWGVRSVLQSLALSQV